MEMPPALVVLCEGKPLVAHETQGFVMMGLWCFFVVNYKALKKKTNSSSPLIEHDMAIFLIIGPLLFVCVCVCRVCVLGVGWVCWWGGVGWGGVGGWWWWWWWWWWWCVCVCVWGGGGGGGGGSTVPWWFASQTVRNADFWCLISCQTKQAC